MRDFGYEDRKIASAEESFPQIEDFDGDIRAAFEYWQNLCVESDMANHQAFHLDELPISVIPWSILYQVTDDGNDMLYRFFGSRRVDAHGEDYTNRHVSELRPRHISEKITKELERVRQTCKPALIKTLVSVGTETFSYNMLRLPLTNDGISVSHIVAIAFAGTGPELEFRLVRKWVMPD